MIRVAKQQAENQVRANQVPPAAVVLNTPVREIITRLLLLKNEKDQEPKPELTNMT